MVVVVVLLLLQGGEGEEQRGSFASYYPSLLAPYKSLYRTGDPSDARTLLAR